MANPGYPMHPGGGPPMGGGYGGPPMGGPPMGQMGPPMGMRPSMPPQQMRRGTPKAVPVIVSAGLAVGVFCGLLFGLGTGDEAKADNKPKDKQFVGTKIDGTDEASSTDTGPSQTAPPKSVTDGAKVTGTMKEPKGSGSSVPAGSAATPETGSGAAPTVAVPTIKLAKLTIVLKPETVKDAKITVDGSEVSSTNVIDIPLGDKPKKEVLIAIKAPGFRDVEKKMEVEEGELKFEYELQKKSSGGVSAPKRPDPPGGKGTPTKKGGGKKGGGGLIDI